ncbi:MAG TPA: hypothetical protein VFH27_15685 [Longimicrobiaceae bacterium]|nr:hypothetical protein [Longimicrobiaceae bacterium]
MNSPDNRGTVHELIQQRERLRGWIARLDQVRGDAPDRVAERVRGDYQARLESVTEELSTHREELERDLGERRVALSTAEDRRATVQDALEEVRLRHMIGELDDRAWDQQRPELERDVSDADAALESARADVDDLERLVHEIQSADAPAEEPPAPEPEVEPAAAEPEAEPEPEPEPVAEIEEEPVLRPDTGSADDDETDRFVDDAFPDESDLAAEAPAPSAPAPTPPPAGRDPFGDEFSAGAIADDEDLPWLESLDRRTAEWESGTPSSESGLEFLDSLGTDKPGQSDSQIAEDDLAFLEELDRAIAGNAPPPAAPPASSTAGRATDLPTQPAGPPAAGRLICKECGAPNEPHAWYCEVCGSEL